MRAGVNSEGSESGAPLEDGRKEEVKTAGVD